MRDPWPTVCHAITFPSVPPPEPTRRELVHLPRIAIRGWRAAVGTALLAGLAVGCGGQQPAAETGAAPQPPAARPLAALATQAVALLPSQYLRRGDSTSVASTLGPAPQLLASLDSAIAAELAARGTARQWVMADALARSAKRNPAFISDPHALSAESLRAGVRRTHPRLGEPLASQMRSTVALTEARYGLIPVELRFEPMPAGATRAILRIVLVDARLAEIQWTGDVSAEVATPTTVAIVGSLAARVADLLVAP